MFSDAADNIKAKSEEVITNEQKNNTGKGVESVKYSIDKHFAEKYDKWDKKSTGFAFRVGTTSTVLNKLGVNNKTIYWDATKIKKIKEKHPEMTDSIIKQVPNILENPIIVMESNTVSGRLVLFGDVYDSKNNPVLVALELNPTEKGGKSLNIIKIASAYGKDVDLQGFINKSKILYVEPNKERTHNWLSVNRLKLPLPSTRFGFFNNSISQNSKNVNTKNDESSNDIKYSMGGLKAETADKSALEKAMELEKDGTDSEKIRKETGWFKGYDGKWRFEIDNSELEFKTDIEKNRAAAIDLAKMKVKSAELEEKIVNDTATKAEENEYYNLDEKMIEYRKGVKLSGVINHPKLFEAYPQLKNVDVYYEISSVNRGVYSSNGNVIMLNPMHTIDEQKEAIIHEIQHAIQEIENFANGSNSEYWKNLGYSDEEAMAMYYNTAGEREARDVSARRDYNAEQRKNIRPDIDRKDVVFANSGDPVYSADENIMQNDFEEKVDQIENNTYNSNDVVIMGKTPKILQDIGLNSLPVAMTKNHIYSVAVSEARAKSEGRYKKNTNYHNLGFNTVKKIYEKISNPLMIIAHPDFTNKASRDSTHKVIVLVDLSVNNKQVIAPILVDYESIYSKKRMDVNLVATYFNKNNINDLIKEAIALENNNQIGFYYLDKKRTQSIIKRTGYQLPRRLNNLSSNIIIRKIDSNVNKKINKITQSQQFVRWFGDWQNKPKTASKVVDGNGEPLVVYHQTGNDFTVFDTKHTGAGEFDSEMPTGVFMKSKRILVAYDESIKNADDEAIKKAYQNIFNKESVKLKRREAELNNFCDKTGLLKRNDRVQKYGFGRSTAQKAVQANKKAVAKSKNNSIIKLQINYFSPSDPLYVEAFSMEEEEGFVNICMHGSPQSVQRLIDGVPTNFTASEFAELLKNNKKYNGEDLKLLSCSTGKGDNSFAQQLSKELGIRVKAPDDDVYYAVEEGVAFVGASYGNTGKWRIFENGVEIFE